MTVSTSVTDSGVWLQTEALEVAVQPASLLELLPLEQRPPSCVASVTTHASVAIVRSLNSTPREQIHHRYVVCARLYTGGGIGGAGKSRAEFFAMEGVAHAAR